MAKKTKEFEAQCTVTIIVEAEDEDTARDEIQEKLDGIDLYGSIDNLEFDEDEEDEEEEEKE